MARTDTKPFLRDLKREEAKDLFLRIIAGLILFSSIASEGLAGMAFVNTRMDAVGEIIRTYIAIIEDKTVAREAAGLDAMLTVDLVLAGVRTLKADSHQTGFISLYALKVHRADSIMPISPESRYAISNRRILLAAADVSPPVNSAL